MTQKMTNKKVIRLFAVNHQLKAFEFKLDKQYQFKQLIKIYELIREKYELLKQLRSQFKTFITYKSNVIGIPLSGQIATKIADANKMINVYTPFANADNTKDFQIPFRLADNFHYELKEPYNTVKIKEHRDVVLPYYTYVQMLQNDIIAVTEKSRTEKQVETSLPKRLGSRARHMSLGHTSFNRNRNARLLAEANDPPGFLIVTQSSLPSITDSYKYKSTPFTLESPDVIGTDKCQLVVFDSKAQRESLPKADHCKYFACDLYLPE